MPAAARPLRCPQMNSPLLIALQERGSSNELAHLPHFMTWRTMMIRILSVVAIGMVAGGCGRMTDSGIPKALSTDALLRTAGKALGITFGGTGSSESRSGHSVESDQEFAVTISSGTAGELLAAFRGEVKRQIETMGAKIHGTGDSGGGKADVRAFSYDYSWSGNEGIIRVRSFAGTNGQVTIMLFCYEHRR